jgi:hypothetical protein
VRYVIYIYDVSRLRVKVLSTTTAECTDSSTYITTVHFNVTHRKHTKEAP